MHQPMLSPALHLDEHAKGPNGVHAGWQDGPLLRGALCARVCTPGPASAGPLLPVVGVQVLPILLRDRLRAGVVSRSFPLNPQPACSWCQRLVSIRPVMQHATLLAVLMEPAMPPSSLSRVQGRTIMEQLYFCCS